jgi:hypothetical protein
VIGVGASLYLPAPMQPHEKLSLRSSGLSWRQLEGQIVVLDAQQSTYFTVTGSGTVIWQLLDGGTTLDAIETALLAEYDIDGATAHADTLAFLTELRSRALLA